MPELNLELVGTLVPDGDGAGRAWVRYRQDVYGVRTGETLEAHPQKPRLIQVDAHNAIFDVNGIRESIELPASNLFESKPPVDLPIISSKNMNDAFYSVVFQPC